MSQNETTNSNVVVDPFKFPVFTVRQCPLCQGTGAHRCSDGIGKIYFVDTEKFLKEDLAAEALAKGLLVCSKCSWPENHAYHTDHMITDLANSSASQENIVNVNDVDDAYSEEDDEMLAGRVRKNVSCFWCSSLLREYYIESDDTYLPSVGERIICKKCQSETIVDAVMVQLTIGIWKGRSKEEIAEIKKKQIAEWQARVETLRADLLSRQVILTSKKNSLTCSLLGHKFKSVAGSSYHYVDSDFSGCLAACGRCGAIYDDLKEPQEDCWFE